MTADRSALIGRVLETVVLLGRELTAARTPPFGDLVLGPRQAEALFVIAHAHAPPTPGALAARLGITRGAVTQLVDGLGDLGLVQRVTNPDDGRSKLLRLAPEARRTVERFESDMIARVRPRFEALTGAELAVLADLLARVADAP